MYICKDKCTREPYLFLKPLDFIVFLCIYEAMKCDDRSLSLDLDFDNHNRPDQADRQPARPPKDSTGHTVPCPRCHARSRCTRDFVTHTGWRCNHGHKFTICRHCKGANRGEKEPQICPHCNAILFIPARNNSPIPGIKLPNPLGRMLMKSFHPRFQGSK